MKTGSHRAFSLLELLVVMAILAILVAAAIPGINYLNRDLNLTTAGDLLRDSLELARQTAATKNSTVEVRLYQLPDQGGTTPSSYRAFQLFLKGEGTVPTYTALTKITYLPQGIILMADKTKTTFLAPTGQPASGATPPSGATAFALPGCGTNYNYAYFCYKPSGRTDLDPTLKWFATLVGKNAPIAQNDLPTNFLTVQVDPLLGKAMIYRP